MLVIDPTFPLLFNILVQHLISHSLLYKIAVSLRSLKDSRLFISNDDILGKIRISHFLFTVKFVLCTFSATFSFSSMYIPGPGDPDSGAIIIGIKLINKIYARIIMKIRMRRRETFNLKGFSVYLVPINLHFLNFDFLSPLSLSFRRLII